MLVQACSWLSRGTLCDAYNQLQLYSVEVTTSVSFKDSTLDARHNGDHVHLRTATTALISRAR